MASKKEKKTKGKRKGGTNIKNNYQKVKVVVNTGEYKTKGKGGKEPAYNYPSSTHTTLYVPPSPVPTPFYLGSKEGGSPTQLNNIIPPNNTPPINPPNNIPPINTKVDTPIKTIEKTKEQTTVKRPIVIRPIMKTPIKTPYHILQPVNIPTPIQSIIKEGETTDFRFTSPATPSLERIPYNKEDYALSTGRLPSSQERELERLERQERAVAQSRLPVRVGAKPRGRPPGSKNRPRNIGLPERIAIA